MNESKPTKEKKGTANTFEKKKKVDISRLVWSSRYVATSKELFQKLDWKDAIRAFVRHVLGHFDGGKGDVCQEDWTTTEKGHSEGNRWFSVHRDHHGTRFWIITDLDCLEVTILLPSEN